MGVNINVSKEDIEAIQKPSEWILQRKANYVPAIVSPNEPVKCEIRMMLVWPKGWARPILVNNLVRLSKGIMVGVRYNKDKDWVGASVAFLKINSALLCTVCKSVSISRFLSTFVTN